MKTLFLLDAFAIIYRAHYAHAHNPLHNSAGFDTSIAFGFMQALREVIRREQPSHIGAAFDVGGETFRHLVEPAYKANRRETPDAVLQSIPIIEELLAAFHIPILRAKGYEADDIIGTLAKRAEAAGFTTYMMTPDKDYGQLVSDTIYIYKTARQQHPAEKLGAKDICAKYGIERPEQVIDVLALWGDASDNVAGAPGIGEKGAMRLVAQYGSIENIIANASALPPKQRDSITANQNQILKAKRLVTIDLNAPVDFNEDLLRCCQPDRERLRKTLAELELRTFIKEFCGDAQPSAAPQQRCGNSLFVDEQHSPVQVEGIHLIRSEAFTLSGGSDSPDKVEDNHLTASDAAFNNISNTPHLYHLLESREDIAALAERMNHCHQFCFDTETTGTDPMEASIVGISVAIDEGEAYYVPLNNEQCRERLAILKAPLENTAVAKIGQNIKFDYLMLKCCGIAVQGTLLDTMLMHYLISPEEQHNMDYLAKTLLCYEPIPISALIGKKSKAQRSMADVPVEQAAEYAAEDADITLRLYGVLNRMLNESGFAELYATIEAPLIAVLAEMEYEGVCIDAAALQALSKEMAEQEEALVQEIRTLTGIPLLNVHSPKQLGEALFDRLKISVNARTTSKSGQYSTSEETLLTLKDRHPVVPKILEMRSVKKLLSSYVDTLPALVNARTGRIHTSFNQAVTSTGRLSSNNPNLQNIPIREAAGRRIREAFVPSDASRLLVSADYSQVELRLMAHLSGDENLISAFLRGADVHAATASKIYGIALDKVTAEQRRRAKTANFGIIYGISAYGLSQRLEISRSEARTLIDGYFAAYPRVRMYMDEMAARARRDGYVATLCGRRRLLPDIHSANAVERGYAERNAINAPIQGSAADIIKIAMIRIAASLAANGLRSKMLLQVHDELVFDVPRDELSVVTPLIKREMESAYALKVPLLVELGSGSNWSAGH